MRKIKHTYDYFVNKKKDQKVVINNRENINNIKEDIIILCLGYHFNKEIYNLQKSVTCLDLGVNFNKKISKLPFKLEKLSLGYWFNKKIIKLNKNLKIINFYNNCHYTKKKLSHLSKDIKINFMNKNSS